MMLLSQLHNSQLYILWKELLTKEDSASTAGLCPARLSPLNPLDLLEPALLCKKERRAKVWGGCKCLFQANQQTESSTQILG